MKQMRFFNVGTVTSALCISLLAGCGGSNGLEETGATRLLAQAIVRDGPPPEPVIYADGRKAGPGPGQCPEGKAECEQLDPTLADNFRSGTR